MSANGALVGTLLALGLSFGLNKALSAPPATPAPPAPANAEQGVQVLTRGPVHEAFAETVTFDPEPGIVVPKAPPAAIEEVPPEQRPEGANVAWIPGYWGWDDERNDFLWVSGIWRDLPPGRQWVPGYWGKSGQGFQWTSGYWADAKASEVEYLPEPPATVEAGPNIAAPSPDDTWLPGCWVWQQNRYAWRPGFWAAAQPDWVWIPAHYVWAPRGYVYVDGYWDYSIGRRGVLFAPVYFSAGVYATAGFLLLADDGDRPGRVRQPSLLAAAVPTLLFRRLLRRQLPRRGVLPLVFLSTPVVSATIRFTLTSAGSIGRTTGGNSANRRTSRTAAITRISGRRAPGRTREGWTARVQARQRGLAVATPLDELRRNQNGPLRFQPVDQAERQRLAQHAQQVQRFREQRQRLENNAAGGPAGTQPKEFAPARVTLPRSPIVAKPGAELGKDPLRRRCTRPRSRT